MICTDCGKEFTGKKCPNGLCQGCYNYLRKGGTVNPVPPKGVIAHDHRGCVVCHICGRAYSKLGSHIKESHHMTMAEYKKEFGICQNSHMTENNYAAKMHNYAYKYNMPEQLKTSGKETRIKKGQRDMRLGKEVRLQERLDRSNRMRTKHVCAEMECK